MKIIYYTGLTIKFGDFGENRKYRGNYIKQS